MDGVETCPELVFIKYDKHFQYAVKQWSIMGPYSTLTRGTSPLDEGREGGLVKKMPTGSLAMEVMKSIVLIMCFCCSWPQTHSSAVIDPKTVGVNRTAVYTQ